MRFSNEARWENRGWPYLCVLWRGVLVRGSGCGVRTCAARQAMITSEAGVSKVFKVRVAQASPSPSPLPQEKVRGGGAAWNGGGRALFACRRGLMWPPPGDAGRAG